MRLLENFLSALTMQAEKIGHTVVFEAAPKPRAGKGMAVQGNRGSGIESKSRHKAYTSHRDFTRINRENVTIWDVHWPQHPSAGHLLLSHLHTTSTAFKKLGFAVICYGRCGGIIGQGSSVGARDAS